MKATGIVRRIDDLAGAVIPKEIRAPFVFPMATHWRLIQKKTGEVILKKYSTRR